MGSLSFFQRESPWGQGPLLLAGFGMKGPGVCQQRGTPVCFVSRAPPTFLDAQLVRPHERTAACSQAQPPEHPAGGRWRPAASGSGQ